MSVDTDIQERNRRLRSIALASVRTFDRWSYIPRFSKNEGSSQIVETALL